MKRVLLILMAVLAGFIAKGQQVDDCPGFRNPTSFVTNNPQYFWVGRVGERVYYEYHHSDTTRGDSIFSTAVYAYDIPADSLSDTIYYSTDDVRTDNACHHTFYDANKCRFQIITGSTAGIDQFTVSYPGSGMQRIPPGYTSSIRLGDMRSTGFAHCIDPALPMSTAYDPGLPGNRSSEALIYTMYVTPFNALLIINYAVVARRYDHEAYDAGEFLIRVVRQDTNGNWPNAPINDSLWYKVSAPHHTGVVTAPWVEGRQDGDWPCVYVYKPWARVAISLSDYIYENVRIEMYTSDCIYNADPLYAYICGDYQPMVLFPTGCPDPESDALDTLVAPAGMLSYEWYVSTNGTVQNIYSPEQIAATNFRLVHEASTDNRYAPRLDDFRLTEGPNAGDTVAVQTFRCVMTSAMDPAKPMHSNVYVNLKNRRPIIKYHWNNDCTGKVDFFNESTSTLPNGIDTAATYWVVYADTLHTMPLDTLRGDTVSYTFPREGRYGVMLYCATAPDDEDSSCGVARKFVCTVAVTPPAKFAVQGDVHCDSDRVVFVCTAGCNLSKQWTVGDSVFTSTEDSPLNVLGMNLPKGSYIVTLTTMNEAGCLNSYTDTLLVYGNPEVSLGGDKSEICLGDSVTVTAVGNGDDYQWSSSPEDTGLVAQQGQSTVVLSPRQTTVYHLLPSSDNPCSDGGYVFTINVIPQADALVHASMPSVSVDAHVVSFTDATPYRGSTRWIFSDGVQDSGVTVRHDYNVGGQDSVGVWMESCTNAGCCNDATVWLPVKPVAVWFPNVFFPGQDERFKIETAIPLTRYEIYIYNREGLLVHRGIDPADAWNGTDLNGRACVQGAYVYWYRYATNDNGGWHEGHGTVTLLR